MTRGGVDVDVVHAHSGATDHAEARGGREDLGGDLRLAAHDERIVIADALDQRRSIETHDDINVARGAQARHAVLGDRVRDEDACHGAGRDGQLRGDAHPTLTGSAWATVPRAAVCAAATASPPRVRSPVSMRPASSRERIA